MYVLAPYVSESGSASSPTYLLTCYLGQSSLIVLSVTSSSLSEKSCPRHSHTVAISVSSKNFNSSIATTTVVNTHIDNTYTADIEGGNPPTPIRMARQACLQPHIKCRVMGTPSTSGIHSIVLRKQERTRQLTFTTHGVIDVLPSQPLHILTSNFSRKAMHLRKHMVVAYVTEPPPSVLTASSLFHH